MSGVAPRPPAMVVFRPDRLLALGRGFQRAAGRLSRSQDTLRPERTPRLNNLDPQFSVAAFTTRAEATIIALGRAAQAFRSDAELIGRVAAKAQIADGWQLQCRLPDSVRQRIDDEVGQHLGSLLTLGAVRLVEAADRILSSTGDAGVPDVFADTGGTFTNRVVPIRALSGTGTGALIQTALAATNDQRLLRHDEFGLIDHGRRRFTVVLPGVTDLSRPDRGWHDVHRSARDLDMAALRSSRSSRLDDNPYGQIVAEALAINGVPDGARLMMVGHSFGADTALDLAADPAFGRRYDVARVVATGYHSQPQLAAVGADTDVLVVQNRHDVVIAAVALMPTETGGILGCNEEPAEANGPNATDPGHRIIRFNGRWQGLGHDVAAYQPMFEGHDGKVGAEPGQRVADGATTERVGRFLQRADHDGFGPADSMLAIDISLPSR